MSHTNDEAPTMMEAYRKGRQDGDFIVQEVKRFGKGAHTVIKGVEGIVQLVAWGLGMAAELVLHYRFGERYLSIIPCLTMLLVLLLAIAIMPDAGSRSTARLVFLLAIVLIGAHTGFMHYRNSKGVKWHSRSPGLPWLALIPVLGPRLGMARIYFVVEPMLVVAGGLMFVRWFGNAFGWIMVVTGCAMGLSRLLEYARMRGEVLDVVDAELEGQARALHVNDHMADDINRRVGICRPAGAWPPPPDTFDAGILAAVRVEADREHENGCVTRGPLPSAETNGTGDRH